MCTGLFSSLFGRVREDLNSEGPIWTVEKRRDLEGLIVPSPGHVPTLFRTQKALAGSKDKSNQSNPPKGGKGAVAL